MILPAVGGWFAALLAVLSVLISILSAMLERSGPIRLRHWAEEAGGRLRKLYETPERFEAFRYLLSWLAKLAPVALFVVAAGALSRFGWIAAGAGTFSVVAAVLAATELANRTLVAHDPEQVLRRLTVAYRLTLLLLLPLVALLGPLLPPRAVHRRGEEELDEASHGEIEAFISVGTSEGILEPGEEELVWGVVDFGDTRVRSVMTPRTDVVGAAVDSDLDDLAELFLEAKHSRLPLYQGSIDHVVGILHIRDLLSGLRSGEEVTARELASPPYFVPETKPLAELLREFQTHHRQMAIVVDEYGGTAGLVTVEDLLEEIVGEISEEHEELRPANEPLGGGKWRFDGQAHIDELEEVFEIDIDSAPYETIGGLVISVLGDVPEEGEAVEAHGLRLEVERVAERRVRSVVVERLPAEESGA